MINFFITLILRGSERTIKAKRNIIASIFIKGFSIVIGFLLVPLTIDYLNNTKYGIWITISSFLSWFTFFEIGLGAGLRNKLAEALAKKNYYEGKIYVSTTYAILSFIIGFIAILFFISNNFIDWTSILNAPSELKDELSKLAQIVFGFFFLRFVLKLIGTILYADQRPAISNLFGPLGNLISLILIYIFVNITNGSLLILGFIMSSVPVFVLSIASIILFLGKYRHIAPSFQYVKLRYAPSLITLGFKFFLIQISALIMFQTSNVIISHYFGPAEVTPYNIAYRYFSIINMLFTIIITPFWSAHTEAWVKKDYTWIKNTINKLLYVWFGFLIIGIIMIIFSNLFFNFWIGKHNMENISVPILLRYLLLIQFLISSFGGIYNMFINGVGKIKLQTISLIIGAILFIPLALFFIKVLGMGIESVVLATIISNFYSLFISPIQYHKLINSNAYGIWNK